MISNVVIDPSALRGLILIVEDCSITAQQCHLFDSVGGSKVIWTVSWSVLLVLTLELENDVDHGLNGSLGVEGDTATLYGNTMKCCECILSGYPGCGVEEL